MKSKSKGRLFIHLGPPKTGTTSFQYLLQKIEKEEWFYGGITQPRSGKKELSKLIFNYCSGQNNDLKYVCYEIDFHFKKFKNIFISEEMLLVHQNKSSLTDKLSRLKVIAANYNTTYIYVSRSTESVLPSYYQERHRNLPEEYQKNFGSVSSTLSPSSSGGTPGGGKFSFSFYWLLNPTPVGLQI
ncbi:hypothetical protein SAMN05660413_02354 [Salegentibacter flavus]|uniref:Sulfotransferase domain-containing protein n=2 Tax=Salegentibacter flavus TaxID=287099 RepID=A0A1I5BFQ0_9FLAO|nr:hypothetical protein SAMN05660413_02354 [Salegentibacter flavus]